MCRSGAPGEARNAPYSRHGLGGVVHFWRDRAGREVDLVIERGGRLQPVEIKAGATVTRDALRGLERWCELAGDEAAGPRLIYAGSEAREQRGIRIQPWRSAIFEV